MQHARPRRPARRAILTCLMTAGLLAAACLPAAASSARASGRAVVQMDIPARSVVVVPDERGDVRVRDRVP